MVPLFDKLFGSNTLYYPGCLTKFVALDLLENYRTILRKLDIDFIELKELEVCCGSPVLKAGYADDFKNLAEKNRAVFKEHSVGKIITNCPACAVMFKKEYPKVLGERWDIEVEHVTQVVSEALPTCPPKPWRRRVPRSSNSPASEEKSQALGIFSEPAFGESPAVQETARECGCRFGFKTWG